MNGSNEDAGPSKNDPSNSKEESGQASKAADALKKLNIQDLFGGLPSGDKPSSAGESNLDMDKHKFWQTQPVPRYDATTSTTPAALPSGPIEPEDLSRVPKDPYPLISGFEWVTMDLTSATELNDVYALLYQNYVEDTEAMFRFNYSSSFLNWALKSPGWRAEWHIGIRATTSHKLVAFISGVPCELRVRDRVVRCAEINFLCVHKKLRSKRLAPVLIREVTRRCNLAGIWQAIYTGGIMLPTPVATCRYFHRPLDWPKLYEVGFSHLPPGSSRQRQVLRFRLAERTATKGLREMVEGDVAGVLALLKRYLEPMEMAQEFTADEVRHWMLNADAGKAGDGRVKEKVVYSYVVEDEQSKKITDFVSFYCIESTVIGNEKHKNIKVAYLYYYASEAAFDPDNGVEKKVLKTRLNELMNDALVLAKQEHFDVFNALTMLDNPLFLQEQKFGPGDGRLHFYLYNYRTPPIQGGINAKSDPDISKMGGVGVVML